MGFFSNMIQAFDLASRMDQMRMMEQTQRLAQQRTIAEAQSSTVKATVAVKGDGYEVVRQAPVSLNGAPVEIESSKRRDPRTFRRNEGVDAAAQALSKLNEK
jgi:hypothetical protein